MSRIIFHIDADSAYLSWEAVYRLQHGEELDLRTVPSVVGGDPKKRSGIVLAKSGPAKKFNIHTGETLVEAVKKCPNLIIVPPNYSLYLKCSNAMVDILRDFSPLIQRFSVDECFLDFTGMHTLFPDPVEAAETLRQRIKTELGFTVSIGISGNKLLAKMAGELKKPDGVSTLWPDEIAEKMWPLPVQDLFMVGRATLPKLHKMSIYTIGDLAAYDPKYLGYAMKSQGMLIWRYANGLEDSLVRVQNRAVIKSIGNSTTIPFNIDNVREANLFLLSLTETVAMRLREAGLCAMLVSITIRTSELETYSHQRKFFSPTDSTKQIYEYAKELFAEAWNGELIRHLGVRISEFCDNDFIQLNLFDTQGIEKQRALDQALDRIRERYNDQAVIRSCFLHSGIRPLSGGVSEDDCPLMNSLL